MVSLPYKTKPGFCFYRILFLPKKSVKRVSQNLDNISFTSNYIKYLELTAVNCAYNSGKNGRHLKKKN